MSQIRKFGLENTRIVPSRTAAQLGLLDHLELPSLQGILVHYYTRQTEFPEKLRKLQTTQTIGI